jgi:glyoxylase-like metal-dependent hydrolase (beta-lactamase superfamily II)
VKIKSSTWSRTWATSLAIVAAGLLVTRFVPAFAQPNQSAAPPASGVYGLNVLPVQGNVSMIVGAGANIAVSVGSDGVLLVDTGQAQNADRLLNLIQTIAPGKDIRYIINTHFHADHVGGNEKLAGAGRSIVGGNFAAQVGAVAAGAASIYGQENLYTRLSAPAGATLQAPSAAWPTNTFLQRKELYFNGESIVIEHQPNAHTDGDAFVYFRKSDVVVAGDIFNTITHPVLDTGHGGGVNGVLDGLNRLLDVAIPKDKQEAGTYVIPGHGRLSDEADVLEVRDTTTIIRDRIADLIKKGQSLQQVKDARPALDYEARYGSKPEWNTDAFVTAVYSELAKTNTASGTNRTSQSR